MKALVYVHGTNGSGKSTLARAVVAAAGGAQACENSSKTGKAFITTAFPYPQAQHTYFLGRYDNACGGLDGYSPFALVLDASARCASVRGARVFAEGLVTPGVETCQKLAAPYDRAVFIHLDTPVERCVMNVMARRRRKGTTKPYDPANLYKKAQSAASWAKRLKSNGLEVHTLDYRAAYQLSLNVLGLDIPDVDLLLS